MAERKTDELCVRRDARDYWDCQANPESFTGACYQARRGRTLIRGCVSSLSASKLFVEGGEAVSDGNQSLTLLLEGRGRRSDLPQLISGAIRRVPRGWGVPVRGCRPVDLASHLRGRGGN